MKFLVDACVGSGRMRSVLDRLGHDALFAADMDIKASDAELLALSVAEGRVLVTEDKDFGELVFVRGLPHSGIIRFSEMGAAEKAAAMEYLLEHHSEAMREGAVIVVTQSRVRIRGERPQGGDA